MHGYCCDVGNKWIRSNGLRFFNERPEGKKEDGTFERQWRVYHQVVYERGRIRVYLLLEVWHRPPSQLATRPNLIASFAYWSMTSARPGSGVG